MRNREMARIAGVVLVAATLTALPSGTAQATSHLKATPIASGLAFPAGFTFAPNGTIFYGERLTGRIRIFNPANSSNRVFFRISNVVTSGEQGLLGVALHPNYPTTPYVYASVVRSVSGVPRNQIVRIRNSGGTGSGMTVIYNGGGRSNTHHVGGRILFGPDGMLYLVVGDKGVPSNAQNLGKLAGKVLRMLPSGGVPSDNPFSSRVYAYGIRNSFGLAFDPSTDDLWETENGPGCNDETNPIIPGGNYAWGPSATCSTPPSPPANTNQDGPNRIMPATFYSPSPRLPALTGIVFCDTCGLGAASEGHAFMGAWNHGNIRELTLDSTRTDVTSDVVAYVHNSGVLSLERAPNGAIYFSDADQIFKLELA
ncbi:MAG TPA: PQQ-dependent sugar dehydrogenase [Actinomycetota bacterium]|nr:PQQ-dependent sugar dehydrogenase [Actinomycetota bacterium]